MSNQGPVIIVGAPRSGTSLMQKLIRETPGFVSVPKESDMIWMPYCHPSLNDWQYEGCPDSRITPEVVSEIRAAFASQALSATTWRLFDRLGLMERPHLAAFLRYAYRTLFKPWSRMREATKRTVSKRGRLVDKSVHAGLWLNLVDAVFPDARYIHMVRSPETCIPSMMQGWEAGDRFRTYRIPDSVAPARSDRTGWWCFPMPAGWTRYYQNDLVDICTYQWNAINTSILNHLSGDSLKRRVRRIHLEELVSNPQGTFRHIANLLGTPNSLLYEEGASLPQVNASRDRVTLDDITREKIHALSSTTYQRLNP